jgi:prevent-host-death family protein
MKTVDAFDAKTHLNALLKRVSRGETIQITLRGIPVAMLVPAKDAGQSDPRQLVHDSRQLRKDARLGKSTVRELIDHGRRY